MRETQMVLVPTILCGGAGSRLWPVSREMHPKPFMRLADGQSLLQKAFLRGAGMRDVAEILTITNRELLFKAQDDFAEVNASKLPTSFILEPFGRNTAPAVAVAALEIVRVHGKDAVMLVLAADHLIANQTAFVQAVANATDLASKGFLVAFGIKPDGPETGFGYIEADGHTVLRFVEKPALEKAKEYVASGRFLWNSGMFCFTAGTIITEMEKYCPDLIKATRACVGQSRLVEGKGIKQLELHADTFLTVPDKSIDYAVMERSKHIAVVTCSIGWSDIGSWNAVGDLSVPDAAGNRVEGEVFVHEATNCYIKSTHRMVAAVGVDNLVIVDTPDAVLIVDRDRAQDVRHIYAALKAQGHESYRLHRTVHRPWGTYTVLEEGSGFKMKRIEVRPGASLSLQLHHHRSEHWIVVNGTATVVNGEKQYLLKTNESTYIPAGHKHRLGNPGVIDLVMLEIQSGEYLGEDDIVRFEDDYGRV